MMTSKVLWRPLVLAILPGVLLAATGLFCGLALGWRLNISDSLPAGIWKIQGDFQRGSVVSVCLPLNAPSVKSAIEWGYFHDGSCPGGITPLLKEVLALPGDTVDLSTSHFSVNGKVIPNTETLIRDGQGRMIHAIDRGRYVVDQGSYWIIANRIRGSYDSRYFGPVPAENILHAMQPVWLF